MQNACLLQNFISPLSCYPPPRSGNDVTHNEPCLPTSLNIVETNPHSLVYRPSLIPSPSIRRSSQVILFQSCSQLNLTTIAIYTRGMLTLNFQPKQGVPFLLITEFSVEDGSEQSPMQEKAIAPFQGFYFCTILRQSFTCIPVYFSLWPRQLANIQAS